MIDHAQPTLSSAAASLHGAATFALELLEARQQRDALKALLRKEQAAMADFLVALAAFDRRRGWEPLGHASLFAFLVADLRLSKSAAYYRRSAAELLQRFPELLQRFPEVIEPLHEGKLCLSTVGELAKVLTAENEAVVTPRFFSLSSREAQELVAELLPRAVPSTRMVVTRVQNQSVASPATITQPLLTIASRAAFAPESAPLTDTHPAEVPLSRALTSDFAKGGGAVEGAGTFLPKPTRSCRSRPTCAGSTSTSAYGWCRSWRPLDSGGCCGSTHRPELDHIIPWAEWGPTTVENLRVVCHRHNALAARHAFGERQVRRYAAAT